jgi:hypothetical protein
MSRSSEYKNMVDKLNTASTQEEKEKAAIEISDYFQKCHYTKIPKKLKCKYLTHEECDHVMILVSRTGNEIKPKKLIAFLDALLEKYKSFADFEAASEGLRMIKDGLGPGLSYAFERKNKII